MNLKNLLIRNQRYKTCEVSDKFKKLINNSTISYEGIQLLEYIVNKTSPKIILEFGSGLSTLLFSKIKPKDSLLISVEDSSEYLEKTKKILDQQQRNIILHHAPITKHFFNFRLFLSYSLSYLKYLKNIKIDLVFIDGPLAYKYGREFCIYAIRQYITNDTIFILDDSNRVKEQEALSNWHKVFKEGLELIELKHIKNGVSVFRIKNPKKIVFFPFFFKRNFLFS